jgi:hypothetical protein
MLPLKGLIFRSRCYKTFLGLNKVLMEHYDGAGNSKGGSITVLLTSCMTGLESAE